MIIGLYSRMQQPHASEYTEHLGMVENSGTMKSHTWRIPTFEPLNQYVVFC